MRITLRVIIGTMSALESSLDEICLTLPEAIDARKQLRRARQSLSSILDSMIDSGKN